MLRYTALGLGIFYGFTHQRSITSSQKAAAAQKEYERKEKLIEQAKAEFAKKNSPVKAADAGGAYSLAEGFAVAHLRNSHATHWMPASC